MTLAAAVWDRIAAGGWLALAAALVGGLVSSVNPCVIGTIFLLVSFTATYGGGRGRTLAWSLAFAAGTVVAFTALGLVAAQVGTFLGLISRRWYLLLAAITAWMGLQTLHVVPSPGWATPGGVSGRRGAWLALLLGGLAAIILSPCATPVLIAVLGLAATRGGGEAVGLLFAYGLGRAIPLVAIGLSAEYVQRALGNRDARTWVDRGRVLLGVGILGLAMYFLYLGL